MYRIVVADDEPIERIIVGKIIKKHFAEQLEIVEAVNGREAVRLFEEKECHMALLDIEMPGINGLEAAELIRKSGSDSSIIFLTAFDEFSYAKKAISVKALDYLLKPVAEEELVSVLEEAVRLVAEQDVSYGNASVSDQSLKWTEAVENLSAQETGKENKGASLEELRMHAVAESVRGYIEAHYMEDITLQDMAAVMNYSEAYFCKLFKQCFDKSFVSYLTWFRMEKAKELLGDPLVNVKDISNKVGYQDSNYFAKVFKRLAGMTPSEYRLQQVLQTGEER